mgnify:CR=1 FL=1
MDVQKIATYGTAVAVVGTGSVVGGGTVIDNMTGGPQKRIEAERSELQLIIREEVRSAIKELMPTSTGDVVRQQENPGDYKNEVPK